MVARVLPAHQRSRTFRLFLAGSAASTVGVLLHLPMYRGTRDISFHSRQHDARCTDARRHGAGRRRTRAGRGRTGAARGRAGGPRGGGRRAAPVRALDEARLGPAHVALIVVMAVAGTIDAMKPAALAFVAPGVAAEYGLVSPVHPHAGLPVALLPLVGIAGTVLGSLAWGWLADAIGGGPRSCWPACCSRPGPSAERCRASPGTW